MVGFRGVDWLSTIPRMSLIKDRIIKLCSRSKRRLPLTPYVKVRKQLVTVLIENFVTKMPRDRGEGVLMFKMYFSGTGVPRCYRELLETSRRMAFKERPDYERLRRLFYEELERRGWAHDSMFDWIQK